MVDYNEKLLIKTHNTVDNGYNIANGGRGRSVVNVSEDLRKKLSRRKDGQFYASNPSS